MLERGAARHSTAPGPGPRAGRCATPPPGKASPRCDPGPIVGSLHRLGWGDAHDASRGWQRRRHCSPWCPRPAFSGRTLRAYSPRVLLAAPGLATLFNSSHHAKLSPRQANGVIHEGGGIAGRRMLKKRTRTSGWRCRRRRYPCSSLRSSPADRGGCRRRWPSRRSSAAPSLCVVKTIQASLAEPEPFGNRCYHSP